MLINRGAGKTVESLSYEAYTAMALKSLEKLVNQVRSSYKHIHAVCISHRIGSVPVGETSVVICVSATHRKEAMHAVEDLINGLKRDTPIWKREVYEDGTSTWKDNCECGHV
eukprot:Partr_v1_DN23587_c0_g1_i2_m14352 putative Catalytic subunit of the molybdopterin synthase complex, a complex that catalyzes the conversion of precursor Z into molybdopterin. Acts by mediating the incorporation of 2 sulfur atoms from thiocarboxylated mocs2a into precursor Z to generate a dithiolene group (By similarity)